jgi:hypothetical protein
MKKPYWSEKELKMIRKKIALRLKKGTELYDWLYEIFRYIIDIEPSKSELRRIYEEARKDIINKLNS